MCVLHGQKMNDSHYFLQCVLGMQEKSSENFSIGQRTPEKQKGAPTSLEQTTV